MTGAGGGDILIQTSRVGGAVEVRAVAADDGLEVSFTAPANALRIDLERLARAKLDYVRRRQSSGGRGGSGSDGRGGVLA
ncbi:MAG: hypothetical protein KGS00_14125 [Alphaproteobacteria bacterium]|nr:hypothetical protein [Alphaproteobacteria bacterium]